MGRRKLGIVIVLAAALAVPLGGCLYGDVGPRQAIGTLGGATGGAFVGNRIGKGSGRVLATAAGALIGAGIGADVGRSLDRANRVYTSRFGHGQQTPVPGFAPAPRRGGSWFGGSSGADAGAGPGHAIRDARSCRRLEGGLRAAFACRNDAGQWFVLQ